MHEEGVINGEDADLIQGVLDLGDRIAYDIMTPRVDVTAIKIDDDSKHILEVFLILCIPDCQYMTKILTISLAF